MAVTDNFQPFSINSWYGGISNDEYGGNKGSCYFASGVDIRSNSREVKLSNNNGALSPTFINARGTAGITQAIINESIYYGFFSADGYLTTPGTYNDAGN